MVNCKGYDDRQKTGDPEMNMDWIEWTLLIGILTPVLRSWWALMTGAIIRALRVDPVAPQDMEDGDLAGNQVEPTGEDTCVAMDQGGGDILELLDCGEVC